MGFIRIGMNLERIVEDRLVWDIILFDVSKICIIIFSKFVIVGIYIININCVERLGLWCIFY